MQRRHISTMRTVDHRPCGTAVNTTHSFRNSFRRKQQNRNGEQQICNKIMTKKDNIDEETLIKVVEKHPIIYNKFLNDYKKIPIREQHWEEIAEEIGSDPESCKKRWRTLRDSFIKVRRSFQITGVKKRRWVFYDEMSFLIPYVEAREASLGHFDASVFDNEIEMVRTNDDIKENSAETHNADTNASSPQENEIADILNVCSTSKTGNRNLRTHRRRKMTRRTKKLSREFHDSGNEDEEGDEEPKERRNSWRTWRINRNGNSRRQENIWGDDNMLKRALRRDDPDEQFLLSFLPAFKRLTPKQNAQARLKFQQVIYDIEFGSEEFMPQIVISSVQGNEMST